MVANNANNNSTNPATAAIADPKLQHLITKIIKTSAARASTSPGPGTETHANAAKTTAVASPLSSKQVLDILLNKHREYRRKNSASLLACIENLLTVIGKKQGLNTTIGVTGVVIGGPAQRRPQIPVGADNFSQNTINANGNDSEKQLGNLTVAKKRRRQEDEDGEYDREAEQHDLSIESQGSSMLNANLRSRYKDIQRERDIVARKKVDDEDGKQLSPIPESSSSGRMTPTNGTTTSAPNTPSTKKKKKKMSRSSSSNSLHGGQDLDQPMSSLIATPTQRPKERYTDLGGMSNTLTQIRQLIEYPLAHPELFSHLGIHPPRGVLLRGPPGCGKTHLANAIAGQLNVTYFRISAPEIVSGMSGESEGRIRDLFSTASAAAPSIIFMDEIDAIAPKRGGDGSSSGGTKGMEKRMVAQLLTCMDSLTPENNRGGAPVMVLGATNRPDSIDSALRRAGRFDREICLGVPDEEGRLGILKVMTEEMRMNGDIDFRVLAKKTPGFVGADIRSLTKEAGIIAINRIFKKVLMDGAVAPSTDIDSPDKMDGEKVVTTEDGDTDGIIEVKEKSAEESTHKEKSVEESTHSEARDIHSVVPLSAEQLEPLFVTMDDFLAAVPHVQPSSKREGFATVPDVSWDNIGALQCIREELTLSVLEPITHPEKFRALGLPLPAGVLLYGPPGCGKTLLAKAIANESGANFISVKGPELLDKYVGESERAVRQVFERARSSSPCIVFFDELDSLCPKRGSDSSGGGVSERVVNQLLTEMDGLESRSSVFVIAATNRPELIDPAMLRPGRLDKLLYVPLPSPDDRSAILTAIAKNVKLGSDVDLDAIARSSRADGYSGADCAALLREAGLAVLRDDALVQRGFRPDKSVKTQGNTNNTVPLQIIMENFNYAFRHVMPSVSRKDQARYERMRDRMARARSRGGVEDGEDQKSENSPSSKGDPKN